MYNDKIILNDVNSINKIICFVLFCSLIIFIQNPLLLLVFDVIFLLLTYEYKYLKYFSYGMIMIGILTVCFPPILWINKLACIILYGALVLKIMRLEQVKYLIELTCYSLQSSIITTRLTSFIYKMRLTKNNYQRIDSIRKSYGQEKNLKFVINTLKKSYHSSKQDAKEIVLIHKLRFYNLYPIRTYMSKPTWEKWDTDYLMIHLLILIIGIIIGR